MDEVFRHLTGVQPRSLATGAFPTPGTSSSAFDVFTFALSTTRPRPVNMPTKVESEIQCQSTRCVSTHEQPCPGSVP